MHNNICRIGVSLLASIVLLVGFLQCRSSRLASDLSAAPNCYERAQNSTVLIVCADGSYGSGVIVRRYDRLFIWTAAHVVSDSDIVGIQSYLRERGERIGVINYTAKVIARNDALDVALLYMSGGSKFFYSVIFADEAPLRVGESVYHVGNFGGVDFDGSVSTGVISQVGVRPVYPNWPWERQLDQTTAFVTFGSSGGGIFRSADNALVGILVGGAKPGVSDINLFVPVRHIQRWAESEGLLWAMFGNYAPSEKLLNVAALNCAKQRALNKVVEAAPCPD